MVLYLCTDTLPPNDTTDWHKVLSWMIQVEVDETQLVFYSNDKEKDAEAFVGANPGYLYFWNISYPSFQGDFGEVSMTSQVIIACSKAMGEYARGETRVFGVEGCE